MNDGYNNQHNTLKWTEPTTYIQGLLIGRVATQFQNCVDIGLSQ